MYCNHCGTQLPEGAQFCHSCGGQVGAAPGKRKNLLAVFAVAAAAILAVVLLIVVLKKDSPAEPEPEVPAQMQQEPSVSEPEPEPEPAPKPEPEPEPEPVPEPEPPCAPDPDTYFGTDIGLDEKRKYNITFSENPAQALNDYLHLLEDSYGMTLIYSNKSDNVQQRSMQKGDDELAFVSLELTACDDGTYSLWIMYGAPVELVQAEVAENPPAQPAYAPDPLTFFGPAAELLDTLWMIHCTDDPVEALNSYMDVLQNNYGMTMVGANDEDGYCERQLQKGDDENAFVFFQLNFPTEGDDTYFIWLAYGESITLIEAESLPVPLQKADPVYASTDPKPDPSLLPDFLAHDSSESFYQGTTSSDDVVAFLSEEDSVRYVTEDYVQLLLDMGYRISDTEEKSNQFMEVYRWYLTHDDVGGTAVEGSAQVCVKHMLHIPYKSDDPYTEVSITFGSGITYADDGKTDSGSSADDDFWAVCSACNGSKKCSHCRGTDIKKKFQAGIGWVDQNCTFCSFGKCPFCNGTGKP